MKKNFAQIWEFIGNKGPRAIQLDNGNQLFAIDSETFADLCFEYHGSDTPRPWMSINPLKNVSKRTKDNIAEIHNVVVDIDSPKGVSKDTETVLTKVIDYIGKETGIQETIPVIFSGSKGFHVWLQVEPITIDSDWGKYDNQLKDFIRYLNDSFGTAETQIDTQAAGIERVIGIPYTIHPGSGKEVKPLDENLFSTRVSHHEFNDLIFSEKFAVKKTFKSPLEYKNIPLHIIEIKKGVTSGKRNSSAFTLASYHKDCRLSIEDVTELMVSWNKKNDPPLDEKELLATIKSAFKKEIKPLKNIEIAQEIKDIILYHETLPKDGGSKQQAYVLLSELMVKQFKLATLTDNREIFWYNKDSGLWEKDGELIIETKCRIIINKISRQGVGETIAKINTLTFTDRNIFDRENLLGTVNGVYNFNTWEFEEHSAENYLTRQIPVIYNPEKDCPLINKFLSDILKEKPLKTMLEAISYSLYPSYNIETAFILRGKGSNGKSRLMALLIALVGMDNIAAKTMQQIVYHRFAVADLYGKMANISPDLPNKIITETGTFKACTGGDIISADVKFKGEIKFTNKAKLFFPCNEIPPSEDDTDAWYRRFVILDFDRQFINDADENIIEKITIPSELSGFLNKCLKNLKELLARGRFEDTIDFKAKTKAYIMGSDSIKAFLVTECEANPEYDCVKNELYEKYVNFCEDVGRTPDTTTKFTRDVPRWMKGAYKRKETINGNRTWIWKGFKPKDGIKRTKVKEGLLQHV